MDEIISYEAVTETWEQMAETSTEEVQKIVDRMEQEQSALMVYLLALEDYPFNQSEKEIIFYIGTVLWEIMKKGKAKLTPVTPEMLNQSEEANYTFLELLSNDTEADFMSATRSMIDSYPEPEVLRYLVEALMEGIEDYEEDFEETAEDLGEESLSADFDEENNGFEGLFQEEQDDLEIEVIYETEEENGDFEVGEEWEDEMDIRPEFRGLAFVHLKTALDGLIASREAV